jgi:DNA repair protein RadC
MANVLTIFDSVVSEINVSYTNKIRPSERFQIRNSQDIYQLLLTRYESCIEHHEEMWAIYMNNQHKVLGVAKISQGGLSETTADPKIILQIALKANASSIIISHNHPSGNPQPSDCDKVITRKIQEGCKYLDMKLCDHVIISPTSYYSFADDGKL